MGSTEVVVQVGGWLSDRVAIVTGAGHGIGRASALRLAQEGARVGVVDVRVDAADETVGLLRSEGHECASWPADVADSDEVAAAIAQASEHFGRIDILHANAGIMTGGTVLTQTLDEWDRTFAVNIRGMFLCVRAVIPFMQRTGGGSIINTASISGLLGEPANAAYNASKGAIVNFTRQVAVDFARHNIRVNSVCPGWIDTGFNDVILTGLSDDDVATMVDTTVPMGRQGTAEEIAAAVAFLASDNASYITGHALVVDGGFTAI